MKRRAFIVAGLGMEMIFSPVIGLLAGSYADKHFDTKPWLLIAGLVLGLLAAVRVGMRLMYLGLKSQTEKEE